MKHCLFKRIFSLLLAVALVATLAPLALPAQAAEEWTPTVPEWHTVYGYDKLYAKGYFLDGPNKESGGTWVREVYTLNDLDKAMQSIGGVNVYNYGHVTIKLMADLEKDATDVLSKETAILSFVIAPYNQVIFDFNGHTLTGRDDLSTTYLDYARQDFICLYINTDVVFTFTDSVGGGGINFYSSRAVDTSLAALHVYSQGTRGEGYSTDSDSFPAKVIFDGGTYEMTAKTAKYGRGTLDYRYRYRGTVIADFVDVEINDGTFIAKSEGMIDSYGYDMCARELSAFGTVIANHSMFPEQTWGVEKFYEETGRTVINGGKFISDGYAVHHFDNCELRIYYGLEGDKNWVPLDSHFHMNYPTINGGYFEGRLGFTGLTFTYSDGYSALNSRPASQIIPETAIFCGVTQGGSTKTDITKLDWDDLHELKSCTVMSGETFHFTAAASLEEETTTGSTVNLLRDEEQSETFTISASVPSYLADQITLAPRFVVTRKNSQTSPVERTQWNLSLDYKDYKSGVTVDCELYIIVGGVGGTEYMVKKTYDVEVAKIYTVSDATGSDCYVTGEPGWNRVKSGESCTFRLEPRPYWEFNDPAGWNQLEVFYRFEHGGDETKITSNGDGTFTVHNVTDNVIISTNGNGFLKYSMLVITANGTTVERKEYKDTIYTLGTVESYGATMPPGVSGTDSYHWKIRGDSTEHKVGDHFTINGGNTIEITAVFPATYSVTVENGKAYADEAHTIPLAYAKENTKVYLVADEAPAGTRFYGWGWDQGDSTAFTQNWFYDTQATVTYATMATTDITFIVNYMPVMEQVTVFGVTKPEAGKAFAQGSVSVPAGENYQLSYQTGWKDVTDPENPASMTDADFQGGHTYRYKVTLVRKYVNNNPVAAFPDEANDVAVELVGILPGHYTVTCEITGLDYLHITVFFTLPEAPAGLTSTPCTAAHDNDGTITGVTAAMEYSASEDFSGTVYRCVGDKISYLDSGTWYVRYWESDTALASAAAEVTVGSSGKVAAGQPVYADGKSTVELTVSAAAGERLNQVQRVLAACYNEGAMTRVALGSLAVSDEAPATVTVPGADLTSGVWRIFLMDDDFKPACNRLDVDP